MILKGSQRGGEMAMGRHLLKPENEHVEVNEVSGFIASDVLGAMKSCARHRRRPPRCRGRSLRSHGAETRHDD